MFPQTSKSFLDEHEEDDERMFGYLLLTDEEQRKVEKQVLEVQNPARETKPCERA